MDLYLHIGTEKTGSSYLQSLLAINREHLKRVGIHYPKAVRLEQQILNGQVSGGNASDLLRTIEGNRFKNIEDILLKHYKIAQTKHCNRLLLSNELIANALGQGKSFKKFIEICNTIGFNDVRYFLVLRDPVEQALSLYKHRAKSGTAGNIEEWTKEKYHYHTYLGQFFKKISAIDIDITCRKYKKAAGYLETIMIEEWLQEDLQLNSIKDNVNPSLSLSELLFIQFLQENNPALRQEFYNRMLDISQENKASETRLERYHRQVISEYLQQFKDTWELCNQWLKGEEELIPPQKVLGNERVNTKDKILRFSPAQAESMAELMNECLTVKMQWHLKKRTWRRRLGRLKERLLTRNHQKSG